MMRGFLNRVRRASGSNVTNDTTPPTAAEAPSSTSTASGAPPPPHPHEMKDNSEITSPSSSSKERSNSSKGIEPTPKADVALPKKNKRRTSFNRSQKLHALKDLPLLSDTPTQKREALFKQKLQLCSVIFTFDDFESDTRGKEIKRETLLEITEYINSPIGQKILTESLMPDIVEMVRVNLLRTLPPISEDYDPEEDEPMMEAAWPHYQIVYEFFLRFIVSNEVNAKIAKKYIDTHFIRSWIDLFDSEDPRERDYVKTTLHRMYGKFMTYRSFIRKAISQVFYRYIYETGRHNGIGELLEILGSIINGFAIPLKAEHVQFLERCLLPLHKPSKLSLYHPQLSYCITQYVTKDIQTFPTVINGLIKFWPWGSPSKQVLLLNELEELLELCREEYMQNIQHQVYSLLQLCLASEHFQVVERTLYFWNSEHLCTTLLAQNKAHIILPIIYEALSRTAQGHWNATVESLAQTVLKMYMEMDIALYDRCGRESHEKQRLHENQRKNSKVMWESIRRDAAPLLQGMEVAVADCS